MKGAAPMVAVRCILISCTVVEVPVPSACPAIPVPLRDDALRADEQTLLNLFPSLWDRSRQK